MFCCVARSFFNLCLGVTEETCGLRALVKEAYSALGLQTYFTSGETETRAWTIYKGWTAPQAAGVIHSDFERCANLPANDASDCLHFFVTAAATVLSFQISAVQRNLVSVLIPGGDTGHCMSFPRRRPWSN